MLNHPGNFNLFRALTAAALCCLPAQVSAKGLLNTNENETPHEWTLEVETQFDPFEFRPEFQQGRWEMQEKVPGGADVDRPLGMRTRCYELRFHKQALIEAPPPFQMHRRNGAHPPRREAGPGGQTITLPPRQNIQLEFAEEGPGTG